MQWLTLLHIQGPLVFEYRLGIWLCWLKCFVFLCPSGQMLRWYLNISHEHFLPNSPFMVILLFLYLRCIIFVVVTLLNKLRKKGLSYLHIFICSHRLSVYIDFSFFFTMAKLLHGDFNSVFTSLGCKAYILWSSRKECSKSHCNASLCSKNAEPCEPSVLLWHDSQCSEQGSEGRQGLYIHHI